MDSKLEIMRQDIEPCPRHPNYRGVRKSWTCKRCMEIYFAVKSWNKVDKKIKNMLDEV